MQKNHPQIFFHVGLPKTASTFLQRNIFPKLEGIEFVKKHAFKHYHKKVRKSRAEKILFSTELNIGKPRTDEKIQHFARSFPDATPIIVLRRHDQWIRSKYKQHIRKHGRLHFHQFFNLHDTGKVKVSELCYMDKIRFLNEQFNNPAIVLFQEELLNDPWQLIDRLARLMGTTYSRKAIDTRRVKPSYSTRQLLVMRAFNERIRFKDPPEDQHKIVRHTRKKFHAFLLHSVAYLSYLWPKKWMKHSGELIPAGKLEAIRQYYETDWQQSIGYAHSQRRDSSGVNV